MLRGRSWLALATVPALAACSLVYASDLDDARKPTFSVDAGAEGGAPPVVVTEAGADVVTPPATGCAAFPAANFCDDFDTQLNVGDGWDKIVLTNDTTSKAAFDALSYSTPKSFRASLVGAQGCAFARLEKRFSVGARRVTTSVRMRPEAPWKDDAAVLLMALTGCGIILSLGQDAPSYSSYVNVQFGDPLQNYVRDVDGFPTPDEWTDVTLDAKAIDGGVRLDVIYDHASGARDDKQLDLPQCSLSGGSSLVGLGFHCSQDTHDVRYDDVRVSWE